MTATIGEYWPGPNSWRYCASTGLTPWTSPFHECVASSDSTCGILISRFVAPGLTEKSPVAKTENAAGPSFSNSASAAATFIGWFSTSSRISASPTKNVPASATHTSVSASFRPGPNIATSPPLRSCHAQTASAISAPVIIAAKSTWNSAYIVVDENSTEPMFVSVGLPFSSS